MYQNLFHGFASVKQDEKSLLWRGLDDDVDQLHQLIVRVLGTPDCSRQPLAWLPVTND